MVKTAPSTPEEVCLGQLQLCSSQNISEPIFCYVTFEFLRAVWKMASLGIKSSNFFVYLVTLSVSEILPVLHTQYFAGDKIEKNEMGGACSADGEGRGVYTVLVGKSEGKRPLGDPGVDGRIILRWIFRKWDAGLWTGLSWLRIETGGGHLEMR
jgi:hypothetical protein